MQGVSSTTSSSSHKTTVVVATPRGHGTANKHSSSRNMSSATSGAASTGGHHVTQLQLSTNTRRPKTERRFSANAKIQHSPQQRTAATVANLRLAQHQGSPPVPSGSGTFCSREHQEPTMYERIFGSSSEPAQVEHVDVGIDRQTSSGVGVPNVVGRGVAAGGTVETVGLQGLGVGEVHHNVEHQPQHQVSRHPTSTASRTTTTAATTTALTQQGDHQQASGLFMLPSNVNPGIRIARRSVRHQLGQHAQPVVRRQDHEQHHHHRPGMRQEPQDHHQGHGHGQHGHEDVIGAHPHHGPHDVLGSRPHPPPRSCRTSSGTGGAGLVLPTSTQHAHAAPVVYQPMPDLSPPRPNASTHPHASEITSNCQQYQQIMSSTPILPTPPGTSSSIEIHSDNTTQYRDYSDNTSQAQPPPEYQTYSTGNSPFNARTAAGQEHVLVEQRPNQQQALQLVNEQESRGQQLMSFANRPSLITSTSLPHDHDHTQRNIDYDSHQQQQHQELQHFVLEETPHTWHGISTPSRDARPSRGADVAVDPVSGDVLSYSQDPPETDNLALYCFGLHGKSTGTGL
ncbi:unnamed protein product [Amoebophrya sp. A25]|nr:unnamed protein product [Amoebophrya sp. A25]|eukprot:GSA25T00019171001.1